MATANEENNAQFMGATIVAKMTNVKNDDNKQRRVNKNKAETTEWKTSIYVPPSGIKTQANDTFLCCNGFASENYNIHIVCTEDHANERAFTTWQQVLVHRGHTDEAGEITPLRSDKCPLCPSILAGQLSIKKKHLKEAHLDHARVLCKLPDGTDEEVIAALYSLPKIFINETGYCVPEERLRECKFSQCRLVDDSDHCSKFSHCDQTPVTKRECKFSPCRDMDKPEHCAKFLHDTVGHEPSLHQEKQSKKGYNSSPKPSNVEAHCEISATDTECWSTVGKTLNKMPIIVEETDILIQCRYSPCREIDNKEHCEKFSHTNPILRCCKFSPCRDMDNKEHCNKFSHKNSFPPPIVNKNSTKLTLNTFPAKISTTWNKISATETVPTAKISATETVPTAKISATETVPAAKISTTWNKISATETVPTAKISATETVPTAKISTTWNKISATATVPTATISIIPVTESWTIVGQTNTLIQCKYSPCREIDNKEHCDKFSHTNPVLRECKFSPCRDIDNREHCDKFSHINPILRECKYSLCRDIDNREHCSKFSHTNPSPPIVNKNLAKSNTFSAKNSNTASKISANVIISTTTQVKGVKTSTVNTILKPIKEKIEDGDDIQSAPVKSITVKELDPNIMYATDHNGNKYPIKVPFDYELEENCITPSCNCGKNHVDPSKYINILKKGTFMPSNMCWNEQPKTKKRCFNSECCSDDDIPRLHLKNHFAFCVKERERKASEVAAN